jgi:NAD(P)-dependent dehydrogenase (short-subunit alcohol dehydrogenase family)
VKELGGVDILVNNAAHQAAFKSNADITDAEWEHTFKVNIHAMFYLTKAAVPHMKKGAVDSTGDRNMMEFMLSLEDSQWRKWVDPVCLRSRRKSSGNGGKQVSR